MNYNIRLFIFLLLILRSLCEEIMGHKLRRIKWVFLVYHKTGTVLTEKITSIFLGKNATRLRNYLIALSDISEYVYNMTENMAWFTEPEYQRNWYTETRDGSSIRYAHFVRDPFDAVLSAYLYHRQIPSPERWQLVPLEQSAYCRHMNNNKAWNPEWENDFFSLYREPLGRYINDITRIDELFKSAAQLCNHLMVKQTDLIKQRREKRGKKQSSKFTFSEILHAQRVHILDNIRFVALWYLVDNGDLLRMAVNTLYSPPQTSRLFFISDFPAGEKEIFTQSSTRLYNFLMGKDNNQFWSNYSSVRQAVNETIKKGFEEKSSYTGAMFNSSSEDNINDDTINHEYKTGNGAAFNNSHITVGFMSPSERQEYVNILKEDPVIGTLLTLIQRILSDRRKLELKL